MKTGDKIKSFVAGLIDLINKKLFTLIWFAILLGFLCYGLCVETAKMLLFILSSVALVSITIIIVKVWSAISKWANDYLFEEEKRRREQSAREQK